MSIAKDFAAKLYFQDELAKLQAYKEKFGELEAETAEVKEKVPFGEITDADGTTFYFEGPDDSLSVGTKLYGDEDLTVELGAMSIGLENGDVIMTDEFGNVVEIVPAGEESEEEQVQSSESAPSSIKETVTTETNFQEEVSIVEEMLTALAPKFQAYDEMFASINDALGLSKEKEEALSAENELLKEQLSKTVEEKEKFASMPAAESHRVGNSKNSPKFNRSMSVQDRLIARNNNKK